MPAETTYLFRHAVLRDAAYQLQLPGDRSRLHGMAFDVLEVLAGGRPPAPVDGRDPAPFVPHAADAFAEELAGQAAACAANRPDRAEEMRAARRIYLRRGAEHAERAYDAESAARLWEELAAELEGPERGEALRRAGRSFLEGGRPNRARAYLERALEIQRAGPDRLLEGIALGTLGVLSRVSGQIARAEELQRAAEERLRDAGNARLHAASLDHLGSLSFDLGRNSEARSPTCWPTGTGRTKRRRPTRRRSRSTGRSATCAGRGTNAPTSAPCTSGAGGSPTRAPASRRPFASTSRSATAR